MNNAKAAGVLVGWAVVLGAGGAFAQDWPQWRGPHRDNKVTGFMAPKEWPKALSQKWKVPVGAGDSSPVLVGDKLYVLSRQGGDEVISCLKAANGDVIWQDKYASEPATPPAGGIHAGPRATPAVAEGKVCTFGVRGVLSCLDAAKGGVVWRKETKAWPGFYTSTSPLIVDGKCIAYIGGSSKGAVVAYDLANGDEKWRWDGDGADYGSPILMTVEGVKQVVTPTAQGVVGLGLADGKLLWRAPFKAKYNSFTPVIDGSTVICSGPGGGKGGKGGKGGGKGKGGGAGAGTEAFKIEKKGDKFEATSLWKKSEAAGRFNTPVLKDGLLYGLTDAGNFFCMDAKTGDLLWTDKAKHGNCGEILDAGPVLLALTSDSELVAFQPGGKEFREVAHYRVADSATWAAPVVAGNRVFVKDQDTLALWTIE